MDAPLPHTIGGVFYNGATSLGRACILSDAHVTNCSARVIRPSSWIIVREAAPRFTMTM